MNPALNGIWNHMQELGLMALAHANYHASCYSPDNPRWSEFSVLQAAHAAELLIKARIAQEHPMLVFEQLPRSTKVSGSFIDIKDLFEQGRTIQWTGLPEQLWATTGIKLQNTDLFYNFGRLRNGIQHFAPSPQLMNLGEITLRFVFEVIDPFIHECWGLYAIDFNEDYEPYIYLTSTLALNEIPFLISAEAGKCYHDWDIDWSSISEEYRAIIESRVRKSLAE